ncbi:MAG: FG-GAP-like repeat-containing protein [Candidatus Rokuibacteriota bacterium]
MRGVSMSWVVAALALVALTGCKGDEKKAGRSESKVPTFEDNFGHAVAAGDVNKDGFPDVIVGAWGADANGADSGAVYVFLGGAQMAKSRTAKDANVILKGEATIDYFGFSVAGGCDVNGDGVGDVIVGAPLNDGGAKDAGAVYVFHGGDKGPSATPNQIIRGIAEGDQFGYVVRCAGDLNGDGVHDVVVGTPLEDLNIPGDLSGPDTGAVYVLHGSREGIKAKGAKEASLSLKGVAAGDWFGSAVAGVGDVNKDGVDDLLVGAYRNAPGNPEAYRNAGSAYLFLGAKKGLQADRATKPDGHLKGIARWNNFAISLMGAGDVNGDGYADVIVGADDVGTPGKIKHGAVYVFHGSRAGFGSLTDTLINGDNAGDHLGTSVAAAGDVNQDGFADVIVGARAATVGDKKPGAAYVFHGGKEGVPEGNASSAKTTLTGVGDSDSFGLAVASAGDLNKDRFADVIVGAPGHGKSGGVFAFFGSAEGVKSRKATDADLILLAKPAGSAGGSGPRSGHFARAWLPRPLLDLATRAFPIGTPLHPASRALRGP